MSSRLPDDRVSVLDRVDAVGPYFGQCTGRRYAEPFVSFGPLAVGRIELLGDIVKADGRRLWDSGVIRAGQPAVAVEVNLRGVQTLGLLVGSADDGIDWDHAVWADACLHMLGRASPRAVFPPPVADEIEMLAALQYAHFAVAPAPDPHVPQTRLFHNGVRVETPEWIYHCDVSMRQAFRYSTALPCADPRSAEPFSDDPRVVIRHHRNLEEYDAVDGGNQGDTQQLEERFFQDLESCHAALFSAHGGAVQDRPQMSRGVNGWFAWGLGPRRLGAGNLRHLLLEGCGVLSYFRDRPGRLLTQQWLKADFIDGIRTVSGADGEYIGNDRNGWRFFGRYHEGSSIANAWAFALIDECPDNAPVTVACGATEQETLEVLFDGRFSTTATAPSWSAASLWVSLRQRSELLPERRDCVYLSDLTPLSHRQDWGRI